ncbi:MAG: SAM-dependent methyltransferase [Hydrogenophaga sp.]|uniref:SAM-dependent methyltransferase n=1 Tax=Hydrogenophaga sp. TaxID=1904254 RepID=UPI003D0F1482
MSTHSEKRGTLYLVPAPLDFGLDVEGMAPVDQWLPVQTLDVASRLKHWVTENAKSTRAFLKRVDAIARLAVPLQEQNIAELPRAAHKKGDHAPQADGELAARALLAAALEGHDVGLVSEAGMPAIADPGSSIVRAAHALGLRVVPLPGPISLMLALAASGLNGQQFAFVGYVPQETAERARRLRELEALALKTGQTQILIETPYRNAALLRALLQTLHPHTRLAVCGALTLDQQVSRSALVSEWRQFKGLQDSLPMQAPCVFLLGR